MTGSMKRAAREFWRGLTTPTIPAWIASLWIAVLELWACSLWLQPRHLADIDPRYLMETSRDDYARVSLALARFRLSKPNGPEVVYLGSSQAKFALTTTDDAALGRALSERAGFEVAFHDFATDLQHYEDALLVIDQMPPGFQGVVLLAVDDHREPAPSRRAARDRWLYDDAATFDAERKSGGVADRSRSGLFFLDHLDFFAARRTAALRIGLPFDNPYPSQANLLGDDARGRAEREIERKGATRWADPPPVLEAAAPTVSVALRRLEQRGVAAVLFDPPRNPVRLARESARVADYAARIPIFAASLGADYWQFDDEIRLDERDFSDATHVKSPRARAKFQAALFARLAGLLRSSHGQRSSRRDDEGP